MRGRLVSSHCWITGSSSRRSPPAAIGPADRGPLRLGSGLGLRPRRSGLGRPRPRQALAGSSEFAPLRHDASGSRTLRAGSGGSTSRLGSDRPASARLRFDGAPRSSTGRVFHRRSVTTALAGSAAGPCFTGEAAGDPWRLAAVSAARAPPGRAPGAGGPSRAWRARRACRRRRVGVASPPPNSGGNERRSVSGRVSLISSAPSAAGRAACCVARRLGLRGIWQRAARQEPSGSSPVSAPTLGLAAPAWLALGGQQVRQILLGYARSEP